MGGLPFDSTEVLFEGSKVWTLTRGSLPSARTGLRMVRTNPTGYQYPNWVSVYDHTNFNRLIATGKLIKLFSKSITLYAQTSHASNTRRRQMSECIELWTQIDATRGQDPLEDATLERPRMQLFNLLFCQIAFGEHKV